MTKEEYIQQKRCYCCGELLTKDKDRPIRVMTRYHQRCQLLIAERRNRNSSKTYRRGLTYMIECIMCGKPLEYRIGDAQTCPECRARIDQYEKAWRDFRGVESRIDAPVSEDMMPPHLRGLTAKQRQEIAVREYEKHAHERELHARYFGAMSDVIDVDKPIFEDSVVKGCKPQPRSNQSIPKDTAPVRRYKTTNAEGTTIHVESRGRCG